ncbi:Hypothetical protein D9617_38g090760 [Elsinoe fawcettii]|nr:Hypothetical protein D9617_38g090760 [Elsinoe fawcettii]
MERDSTFDSFQLYPYITYASGRDQSTRTATESAYPCTCLEPHQPTPASLPSTALHHLPSPLDGGFMTSSIRSVDDYWAKIEARAHPTPEAIKIVHKRKAKRGGKTIITGVKEVFDAVGGMVDVQRWRLKKIGKRASVAAKRAKMRVKNAGRRESYVSYTGSLG